MEQHLGVMIMRLSCQAIISTWMIMLDRHMALMDAILLSPSVVWRTRLDGFAFFDWLLAGLSD